MHTGLQLVSDLYLVKRIAVRDFFLVILSVDTLIFHLFLKKENEITQIFVFDLII